ncbi:hypothetical protein KIM67_05645 [Flagellimonas sp. 389]|uniref:hypothetical protein n=1 Tax=Flagellimonas sp. 389 TaxID=2835862 RepID=UPI001BD26454|nr:hypothetical protein [Flagellimonas sp. 389]MBS9461886.1 hypothetical protein [Flagellimonas sp. 389]
MNKLLMIYGCALLGSPTVAEDQQSTAATVVETKTETVGTFENNFTVLTINAEANSETSRFYSAINEESFQLNLNEIEFVEEESDLDLGFNTSDYLPEGFDPYETYFDLNSLIYIEDENELHLDFSTSAYLPEGFDAYTAVVDVHSINYIEDEDLELGFDTANYLPARFSPYEAYVDLSTIEYIEDEVDLELGLDSYYSLPEGFNAYTDTIGIASINFIEDEAIDLGFDTTAYLPKNFDPHMEVN